MSEAPKKIGSVDILSGKQFDTRVSSLKKSGEQVDRWTHQLGLSAMVQVVYHGNKTKMLDVLNALPRSSRKRAFITWVNDHANGTFEIADNATDADDIELPDNMAKRDPSFVKWEDAEAKPFYEYTAEKNPKPLARDEVLRNLLIAAGKKGSKKKVDKSLRDWAKQAYDALDKAGLLDETKKAA